MRIMRFLIILLLVSVPSTGIAALSNGDLPAARWYCHVDLVEMRSAEGGKHLYAWLEKEVFDDLSEEFGVDAGKEVSVVTALATPEGGIVVVVEGTFSQATKDKILAIGAAGSDFNSQEYDGKTYYFVGDDDTTDHDHPDAFDDGAYISIALEDKLVVASTEEQMHQLLKSNGEIPGDYGHDGALIVLSAEQSLVQAGMNADGIADDLGWDSNMLRNTKQLALLIADKAGQLSIEAQLITAEAELANSLASIVRGLISLQVFNDDIDSELSAFLQNTTVEVDGATLTVKVVMDPEVLIEAIE